MAGAAAEGCGAPSAADRSTLPTLRLGYRVVMTFTLDPGRPIPKTVRKATEKQLRKTVEALTGQAGLDPDEAAHDARKRTKKVRALLRLGRAGPGAPDAPEPPSGG